MANSAVTVWEQAAKAFAEKGDRLNQAMVLSNLSLAYQQLGQWSMATTAIETSLKLLPQVSDRSPERWRVFAQALNTKASLQLALGQSEQALTTWQEANAAYTKAMDQAGIIRSLLNQAQALRTLGLYRRSYTTLTRVNQILEQQPDSPFKATGLRSLGTQQWSSAQDLTEQALLIAQAINAPDIAYNWQWQLGRLLKARGDTRGAIAAYTEAQFSFQESVEPVYRELVSLLLQPPPFEGGENQQNLIQAREIIESLQLAELDYFFKEACLDKKLVQVDRVNQLAAVIYSIILANRLEVILSLPGQPLRHYGTAAGDKRAALGLAGMAVRAGARSTLATLWSVNDAATANLMSQFYQELANTKLTQAEALRRAQLTLIQNSSYQHPIYWAPYVLVGNWL